MTKITPVRETDMFSRINARIDALLHGETRLENLKAEIRVALNDSTLADNNLVERIATAHTSASLYADALITIGNRDRSLEIRDESLDRAKAANDGLRSYVKVADETLADLELQRRKEAQRADDLQAEKDLIAEKLSLLVLDPEATPDPDEPNIAPADAAAGDSDAAE